LRVIDIHTHPVFFNEGIEPAVTKLMMKRARALGIEHMVALGDVLRYGRTPDAKQTCILNDETAEIMRRGKGFFVGFCALNPLLGEKEVRAEVDRCVGEMGFKGLKLEVSCNAQHPALAGVMAAAREHNVPVLQHSWNQLHKRCRSFHSDPEDTCAMARKYPDVRIIMAHLTGCGYRGIQAARGLDNLVVDTSGGGPEAGLVEYAVEQLGADRVVYGSDLPIRDLPTAVGRITGSPISEKAKAQILYQNAAELLGL
jgi:predicted TIM-barrel fold metal-dependent hydrolase